MIHSDVTLVRIIRFYGIDQIVERDAPGRNVPGSVGIRHQGYQLDRRRVPAIRGNLVVGKRLANDLVALNYGSVRIQDRMKARKIAISPKEGRKRSLGGQTGTDTRTLVIAEDERSVLDDGTACGRAKLVLPELRNWPGRVEKVLSVQRAVAKEFEDRAVKLVGAGLDGYVHHCATRTAEFG